MRVKAILFAMLVLAAPSVRAAGPETVSFESSDGFALTADLWPAADKTAPVAILLHQFNLDRHSFGALVPALQQQGFTILAIDQRGQGDSKQQRTANGERSLDVQRLGRDAVGAVVKAGIADVAAALAFLTRREISSDRIVLIGSSYGCSVSLLAAAAEKRVRAVALLSPGTDYFGANVLPAARAFKGALFAMAADDDPVTIAPGSAKTIVAAHDGAKELLIYPSGGHGVALLAAHPELAATIAAFLADAVARP